ncbi:MAG: purine-cytosine permease family protein [Gaiella sp.]
MPQVESYGVEPIPAELRTAGWRTLFAINFTFFLNPVMMVLGALAVLEGGLPLPWAVLATVLGQALAFAMLVVVARPGVDDGLPGQVAMRATFGLLGARALTSPYRVVAATYWFAAQALTAALATQAIAEALGLARPPLVPTALCFAVVQAALAVLGFDVMRWLLRFVLPLSLVASALLIGLFLGTDRPTYGLRRVLDGPDQDLTWLGFATFVTVLCGSSLTFVTNIADFCRYTPTRRDMQIGLVTSSLLAVTVTTFVGGYAAAASGEANPFVAAASLTSSEPLLVLLFVAVAVQTLTANLTNVYTAGMSLVNSLPVLGRLRATLAAAALAIVLSAFPSFIEQAQSWITHLGNVAAPITGVVLADYLVVQRAGLDLPALFDPAGRYRYQRGLNLAALAAVAAGVAVYYAVPAELVKVIWGTAVAAGVYLVLARAALAAPIGARTRPTR